MSNQFYRIYERQYLLILGAVLVPVVLIKLVSSSKWMSGDFIENIIQIIAFVGFSGLEIWFLGWGVWPKEIIANKDKQILMMKTACPFIYKPTIIPFQDIKKIRVSSYNNTEDNCPTYNLCIDTADNKEVIFGHFSNNDREKYEKWRDELAQFIGLDNITRLST